MKAVVLLSGGLDSTTLVYNFRQTLDLFPISFNYGQKHSRELQSASKTCKKLGLTHRVVDISFFSRLAPSALTTDIEVPEGYYQDESMKLTVVPNRNMVLLALATSYAIGIGAPAVLYGAHGGDHAIYPDCRPEFVDAMGSVMELCDWSKVKLVVPYLHLDKTLVLKKGLEFGVDYGLTWTCYNGREKACGKCGSCQERLEAFRNLGIKDPLEYED